MTTPNTPDVAAAMNALVALVADYRALAAGCSAGWRNHKPVFVESHVRGPKDKPLIIRDTVKVLKGGE